MADGSKTPLKDKWNFVQKFKDDEDFQNIRSQVLGPSRTHCVKRRCEEGLFEDQGFESDLGSNKEWKRAKDINNNAKLVGDKPSRFEALQGDLGDCWLIAAMDAMTLNVDLFNHVVPIGQDFYTNYTGAFHFRIWQLGIWRDVVVDDRLPVYSDKGSLCYGHSRSGDVFWGALLEKAYAKVCAVPGQKATYSRLAVGLEPTGLQDLSGGIVQRIYLEDDPPHPRGIELKAFMHQVFESHCMMVCNNMDRGVPDDAKGLHTKHSYAVTKIVTFPESDSDYHGLCLVRVMNPWGGGEWRGDWNDDDYNMWRQIDEETRKKIGLVDREDGEFWMQESDFVRRFQNLFVCNLEPEQYIINNFIEAPLRSWRALEVYGEWVKNSTAGGQADNLRYLNPQFMFVFEKPNTGTDSETLDPTEGCETLIDLSHRSKVGRDDFIDVAFYIYYNLPIPITSEDVKNNPPLDPTPDFGKSYGRTYSRSISLHPGQFSIIPCTDTVNVESQFLLRVFSQCNIKQETEHDTKTSKPLPMEEESVFESNAVLKEMFIDKASGSDEIDWVGLKNILQEAMNPTFGIFVTFLRYFWDVLKVNLFHSLSDEYKNGRVIFTKNECRSMIAMMDEDHSGKLNISEFFQLWRQICFWAKVYDQHRDIEKGYIKVTQLRDALGAIGYDITKRTIHSLSYVYADEQGLICLTDFILCGVTLETALTAVEKADIKDKSKITFTLEEWVKNTLLV